MSDYDYVPSPGRAPRPRRPWKTIADYAGLKQRKQRSRRQTLRGQTSPYPPQPPPRRPGPLGPYQGDYPEASALVRALLDPQIQSVTKLVNDRAFAGMNAIRGYTAQLAKDLSGYAQSATGIYGEAQQSQAAVSAALRQALAGGGQQLADELGGKLAGINAPGQQVQDVAGGAGQIGETSGNAAYALGSADLTRLIGEGAANASYFAKQPGIAGLTGLQYAKSLQQSSSRDLAERLAELNAQAPGLLQQTLADLYQRRTYGEETRYKRGQDQYERQRQQRRDRLAEAAARQEYGLDIAKLATSQQTAAERAAAKQQTAAQKQKAAKQKQAAGRQAGFYKARSSAFSEAQSLAGSGRKQPQIVQALWQRYGQELVGRGYQRSLVMRMIRRAAAYGAANPKTKKGSGSSSSLVP